MVIGGIRRGRGVIGGIRRWGRGYKRYKGMGEGL